MLCLRHLVRCVDTHVMVVSVRYHNLYYWNQMFVLTNINDSIGSHLSSTHRSQSLFKNKNLISMTEKGLYVLMPYVVKAMNKLVDIIDDEMRQINAHKISMPSIVAKDLWDISNRWEESKEELFRLTDRQKTSFCLAPTHEEVVTQLVSKTKHLSESHLPIYLYQITNKFRDEIKAKHGLLRGREFLMKDLYTFDANEEKAKETYDKVCNAYENIFKRIDLTVIKVRGSVGNIGGKYSQEFMLVSDLGEDEIYKCNVCESAFNTELIDNTDEVKCLTCNSNDLKKLNAIEVGHTFLLGTRYSHNFNANYISNDSEKSRKVFEMGCYGLGVTRILAASVEVLSQNYSIRWPKSLVPFRVCLVLPKKGSKEDVYNGTEFSLDFAKSLTNIFNEDVFIDDRTNQTIGKRLFGLQSLGFPYIIIAGKRITEEIPIFEVIDNYRNDKYFMNHLDCIKFLG
ncbi:probable proline--tRNA ligase, mitochondrial [Oppia nitens]|uniref:probable proline--tRNA ligase, mitochondrial n=1 Tax=Oppia nitens TaxID=1686743 RepID=UPI0023DA8B79|nr:probable proline--tRNA ligase, mitochondrial [Oppia nitens]